MNNNAIGIKGLARILEDLSIQRIKENEIIGSIRQIDGLQAALEGKAASDHTHIINDITNLQAALDGKAEEEHTHVMADITDLSATIESLKNLYAEETVTNEGMFTTEEEANSDSDAIGLHNGGKDLRCFLKLNQSTSGHTFYKRIAPASSVGKRVEIITYNKTGDNLLKVVLLPTNESFLLPSPGTGTSDFTTVQSLEITGGVYVILTRIQVDSGSAWLVNRFPMI